MNTKTETKTEANSIEELLADRGTTYGDFKDVASVAQKLKLVLLNNPNTKYVIDHTMAEALDMICSKIARITGGDPEHIDSWKDIAGYAQLVVNDLKERRE